jgi:gephyrin
VLLFSHFCASIQKPGGA